MSLVYDTCNELVFMGFISDKPTNIYKHNICSGPYGLFESEQT